MLKALISALAILAPTLAHSACVPDKPKSYGHVVASSLVGVYDGDSFTVSIERWPPIVGEAIGIRVNGVDTPEIRGKCPAEKAQKRDRHTIKKYDT